MICKTCKEERKPNEMYTIDICRKCADRAAETVSAEMEARRRLALAAAEFLRDTMKEVHRIAGGEFTGCDDPAHLGPTCNTLFNKAIDVLHGSAPDTTTVAALALLASLQYAERDRRSAAETKEGPAITPG